MWCVCVYIYIYIYIHIYYSAITKEQNNAIYNNMGGPTDCHMEWNKSDRGRQIPCDIALKSDFNKSFLLSGPPFFLSVRWRDKIWWFLKSHPVLIVFESGDYREGLHRSKWAKTGDGGPMLFVSLKPALSPHCPHSPLLCPRPEGLGTNRLPSWETLALVQEGKTPEKLLTEGWWTDGTGAWESHPGWAPLGCPLQGPRLSQVRKATKGLESPTLKGGSDYECPQCAHACKHAHTHTHTPAHMSTMYMHKGGQKFALRWDRCGFESLLHRFICVTSGTYYF